MDAPTPDPQRDMNGDADGDTENYTLPCAEALLAGTLALMTGHAQSCCDGHRARMTDKVVGNLEQLARHPVLSAEFRSLASSLLLRWQIQRERQQRDSAQAADAAAGTAWHNAPSTLQ